MADGLVALLDDVAALARLAAASTDDVTAAAVRAGGKTVGVVIDDAAVTPRYVVGLPPERELPIIAKIAIGSLRNKLLFILPAALLLSAFAQWALTPILMLGGLYLSFEAAEKIIKSLKGEKAIKEVARINDPAHLEARQIAGAIRTDLVLSAEIMLIALNELSEVAIGTQALVLALVGIVVTISIYGVVGAIVKMDDVGLRLSKSGGTAAGFGRAIVRAMPVLLTALSFIGTAAMLSVGGEILIHGLADLGLAKPGEVIHDLAAAVGGSVSAVEWAVAAFCAGIVGIVAGSIAAAAVHLKQAGSTGR